MHGMGISELVLALVTVAGSVAALFVIGKITKNAPGASVPESKGLCHTKTDGFFKRIKENPGLLFKRALLSLIPFAITFIVLAAFCNNDSFTNYFNSPVIDVLEKADLNAGLFLSGNHNSFSLLLIMAVAAFFISGPAFLYIIIGGMKAEPKKIVSMSLAILIVVTYCMFMAGASIFSFYLSPKIMETFIGFEIFGEVELALSLSSMFLFIYGQTICFGLLFELPAASFILARLNLFRITFVNFLKFNVVAVPVITIIAAIFTPPDVISQIIFAIPLLLLTELCIVIIWIVSPKPQ